MFSQFKKIISYAVISGLLLINPIFASLTFAAPLVTFETKVANITNGDTTWSTGINAAPGDTIAFMLKLRNRGDDATNVTLLDLLPADLSYVAGSLKQYQNRGWQAIANDTITTSGYSFGTLTADMGMQYLAFRATIAVSAAPGVRINNGSLSADVGITATSQSTIAVAVPKAQLVTESKVANITTNAQAWAYSTSASPGDELSVLIKVKNTADPAYNTKVVSSLPAGLTYKTGSSKIYQNGVWTSLPSDLVGLGYALGTWRSADGIAYFSFHVTVDETAPMATYHISSTVTSDNADTQISQTSVVVSQSAIANFDFSASSSSAAAGSDVTLAVSNAKDSSGQLVDGTVIVSLVDSGTSPNGTSPTLQNIRVTNGAGQATIKLVKTGLATIKAVSGSATKVASLTIVAGSLSVISVSPSVTNVVAGSTKQFIATGTDVYGNDVNFMPTWTTTAGTINANGLLTAETIATTADKTVTASNGNISDSATITAITPAALGGFSVSAVSATTAGNAVDITARALDIYGNPKTNYQGLVSFSSSDLNAVLPSDTAGSWSNGQAIFTAILKTVGTHTITLVDGAIGNTVTIVVSAGGLSQINLSPASVSLKNGETTTFVASGVDQYGNAVTLSNVSWSLADASAGTIDQTGQFTAADVSGTFSNEIIATSGSVSGYATVKITASVLTFGVSPALVSFSLDPGAGKFSQNQNVTLTIGAQNLSYLVTVYVVNQLTDGTHIIPAWSGTLGFGWSLDGTNFFPFSDGSQPAQVVTSGNQSINLVNIYKVAIDWTTPPGNYQTTVVYTATAGF